MNKVISNLHYITQDIKGFDHSELAANACKAGVTWVQLRVKNRPYHELLDAAMKTGAVCRKYNTTLIINDNVNIAKEVKADGVHLGKTDMGIGEARRLLGNNFIIGGTANTFEDIEMLVAAGVDYIGLGPYRFTTTKENLSPLLGSTGYEKIMALCRKKGITTPIIAIGGIKAEDVKLLISTGVYGIAVSSAINKAEDMSDAIKLFNAEMKFEKEKY